MQLPTTVDALKTDSGSAKGEELDFNAFAVMSELGMRMIWYNI